MRRGLVVEAPAKVNLVLRVLGRRPDGFHDIETLFQAIDLADEVEVWVEERDASERAGSKRGASEGGGGATDAEGRFVELDVEGAALGPVEENLAYRAAVGFLEAAGLAPSLRVSVKLTKRIPAGGGLGGGSSDAAAVLRCLSSLTGALDGTGLARVGSALGSDVPFFLLDTPLAVGRGRGERLEPLAPLPRAHLVVALPPVHVSTGDAYRDLAAARDLSARDLGRGPGGGTERSIGAGEPGHSPMLASWSALPALAHNDFEPVVAPARREIRVSLDGLREEGASVALLSGSGGSSFGLFSDADAASRASERLSDRLGWPFVATTTRTSMPAARPLDDAG